MVPKPLKGRCGGERAGDPLVVPEQIRVTGGERDDRGMDARSEGSDQIDRGRRWELTTSSLPWT